MMMMMGPLIMMMIMMIFRTILHNHTIFMFDLKVFIPVLRVASKHTLGHVKTRVSLAVKL